MTASDAISNRSAKSALLNLEIVLRPQKKDNDGFSIYDTEIVLRVFRMVVVIQTFTNDDQLIFPYGFGQLLQPLAFVSSSTGRGSASCRLRKLDHNHSPAVLVKPVPTGFCKT